MFDNTYLLSNYDFYKDLITYRVDTADCVKYYLDLQVIQELYLQSPSFKELGISCRKYYPSVNTLLAWLFDKYIPPIDLIFDEDIEDIPNE